APISCSVYKERSENPANCRLVRSQLPSILGQAPSMIGFASIVHVCSIAVESLYDYSEKSTNPKHPFKASFGFPKKQDLA
ncbi:MAG: hypothetical protein ACRERV_11475, partial [Methylococcales bacterium]